MDILGIDGPVQWIIFEKQENMWGNDCIRCEKNSKNVIDTWKKITLN